MRRAYCAFGTDTSDCSGAASGGNAWSPSAASSGSSSCVWANDGECDEPTYCAFGTDGADCLWELGVAPQSRQRSIESQLAPSASAQTYSSRVRVRHDLHCSSHRRYIRLDWSGTRRCIHPRWVENLDPHRIWRNLDYLGKHLVDVSAAVIYIFLSQADRRRLW